MKKIIFSILFLTTLFTQGQDPSFSQFDLNMMYSNPAFVGYEVGGGCTKYLLHSRNQWNGLNENFNNSIFEFSASRQLNSNSRNSKTLFSSGFGIISEDLGFTSLGNTIFIDRNEASLYGALHKEWGNWWVSGGVGINVRQYSFKENNIFSDQWDAFGTFSSSGHPFTPGSISSMGQPIIDGSIGGVVTRHGRYRSTKGNRLMIASSLNHLTKPYESFTNNQSDDTRIPLKQIIHVEWLYGIPSFKRPFFPYVKTIFKHERYIKKSGDVFQPWKESLISKTEFGGTVFVNNTNIELGTLFRMDHNFENDYHMQTFISIIRYRFSGNNQLMMSYSYDMNIAGNLDKLTSVNAGTTHEIGLKVMLCSKRRKRKNPCQTCCPAIMDKGALFNDIYNNGLLNKKTPRGNFRW